MMMMSANISGVELDRDNRETAFETTRGSLHGPKIEVWSNNG